MDANESLRPTFWRTCRVLANATRLELLRTILRQGEACVSHLARECHLSLSQTTQHLRLLQARGLLAVRRQGRWVFYSARPDPLVESAAPLLDAVQRALDHNAESNALIRALTAFTHVRRIHLVQTLARGPSDPVRLVGQCRISRPALDRHLLKLARRGVIIRQRSGVALAKLTPGLLADLVKLACADSTQEPVGLKPPAVPTPVPTGS